jgi:DNA-binding transcriptional LysR family regulator
MERLECDRMFVAVIELGSFAKAAGKHGTSSGQASKMVTRLEEELGARLLNRTTRALSPTEVGQAYYERMRVLLEEIDLLDQSVKNRSGSVAGTLKLTAPMALGETRLAPVLIDFAQKYPGIDLDVHFSDRIVNLVDEGFDAAIRIGNPSDSSLIARKLCVSRIVLAASPDYLKQHGFPQNPEDLASHQCIVDTNFRDPHIWKFHNPSGREPLRMPVSGRLRFSSADACLEAAQRSLGIARVPSFMAGPLFAEGKLLPILRDHQEAPNGIHVMYPPGRHLANKVRALVDFLVESFSGEPEWDKGW